ncbi:MAG: EF-hand domain-containing protein [Roseovarius sp.]|uniref:EF-hand domain-containing protein n=1 Tax=Roseovarius sp. TaxID=1486281 RepID=UPI0032ED9E3B
MTRIFTTLLTTTMLAGAPALAATDSADNSSANNICENAFNWGDADENAKLTRTEIENMRDQDYGAIDANSDGEISKQEYVNCLGTSAKMARDEAETGQEQGKYNMAEWSHLADDETTEMSAEDWANEARKAWEDGDTEKQDAMSYGGSASETSEEFARAATQRFKMHDTNGDGIITVSEYETDVSETKFDDQAIQARFNELDADNSGGISPQEYRGAGVWAAQPGGLKAEGQSNATTDGDAASGGSSASAKDYVDDGSENKTSVTADGLSNNADTTGGVSAANNEADSATDQSADSTAEADTDMTANEDQAANDQGEAYVVPVYHYYIRVM